MEQFQYKLLHNKDKNTMKKTKNVTINSHNWEIRTGQKRQMMIMTVLIIAKM